MDFCSIYLYKKVCMYLEFMYVHVPNYDCMYVIVCRYICNIFMYVCIYDTLCFFVCKNSVFMYACMFVYVCVYFCWALGCGWAAAAGLARLWVGRRRGGSCVQFTLIINNPTHLDSELSFEPSSNLSRTCIHCVSYILHTLYQSELTLRRRIQPLPFSR